ncbi:MAG: CBS domain-containing protein [Bacteroidetes bacterium]|nr:MAG: CBS domain-containing protein [Bacteroidota bacterium]
MFNHQMLSDEDRRVSPIYTTDVVEKALQTMEDEAWPMLPVVSEEGIYEGLIFETELLDAAPDETVAKWMLGANPISAVVTDHFSQTAKLLVDHNLAYVPVTDKENYYRGAITAKDLLLQYHQLVGSAFGGALLVLRMAPRDYSIGQLAKLVESNDALITQINTQIEPETGMLLATIRLNKTELSAIISTLQRYDYDIVYFVGQEAYENDIMRNYNHLMNYLDM